MKGAFLTVLETARNFLYPPYCSGCTRIISKEQVLCSVCSEELKPISSLTVQLTMAHHLKVYAVSGYRDSLRKMILKKHNADYFASTQLARLISQQLDLSYINADFIVPIPVHWLRYAWRGFNPSQVMAQELSSLLKIPVLNLLVRTKRTDYQSSLSRDQRFANMSGAFSLNPAVAEQARGKRLLFVDDLYTSGATMTACAKVALECKPEQLNAVVACR